MKTVIVNPDQTYEVKEVGMPVINERQALTKTIANGICGTDVTLIKKSFKGITPEMYPIILGHENVGRVVEVGSKVTSLKVGDVVILPFLDTDKEHIGPYESAWGGFSEYAFVNDPAAFSPDEDNSLARAQCIIPDDIDPVDAVMLVTLREVLSSAKYFGVGNGKPAVIYGMGPVGLTFVKMCKHLGADPVIAVVRNEEKGKNAKAMGADIIVNSSECNVVETIRKQFPQGVSHVIDAVGSEAVLNEAAGLIADRGVLCAYGVPHKESINLDFSPADYNWVLNFQQMPRKDEEADVHEEVIGMIRSGEIKLKELISDYYKFEDVTKALDDAVAKKIQKKGIVVYE